MKQIGFKSLVTVILLATTAVVFTGAEPTKSNLIEGELTPVVITGSNISTEQWEIKTSAGKIPEGWEPFGCDYNDKQDPFLLRRKTDNWNDKQQWEIKTSSGKIPVGWEPFGYDSNDEQDPFLLRRRTSDKWDYEAYLKENTGIAKALKSGKITKEKVIAGMKLRAEEKAPTEEDQKWEVQTSTGKFKGIFGLGNLEFDAGWEPFGYDSNDEQDPFLLRRRTSSKWDGKQKWKVKTSSGKFNRAQKTVEFEIGWEPFAYDSNDEFDPFLLRRRTTDKWDGKQKWEIKTSSGRRIPAGWKPFAYDSNDKFDPFLLRRRIK